MALTETQQKCIATTAPADKSLGRWSQVNIPTTPIKSTTYLQQQTRVK
jgi:hypothetical protein